ncbi:glycosyltransferase [Candidatus Roizmanbacteria bacterium]|nr:glycosyltransferase [Candidatus Roizmanbacteria bacterium]
MKTLTLIIPVYNEGERITNTLQTLEKGFSFRGLKLTKLIFFNDGSTDSTLSLLYSFRKKLEKILRIPIQIVSSPDNRGRGFAVIHSAFLADTEYVLYTDADFSIPLSNLYTCLPSVRNNVDLIFGSKKMPGAKECIPRTLLRKIVGYGHSLVASVVFGMFIWDFQGGFKLFSRKFIQELFPLLKIDRWGFDMEVIFLAKKYKFSHQEIPVTWSHVENGSKVKLLRDSLRSLQEMARITYGWHTGMYALDSSHKNRASTLVSLLKLYE